MDYVNNLLSDLLRVDIEDDDARDLGALIHKKTNGNSFHVLQLIDYLQAKKLLEYSLSTFHWTWDIQKVQDMTVLSDNMLGVVASKLTRLPNTVQRCLQMAACLGFRFDEQSIILNLVKEIDD
jgi:predicted ATPase